MYEKYVIIGCVPRCGSTYMFKALSQLGLDIGHESTGSDGVVGWQQLLFDSATTRQAYVKGAGREKVLLMQTRHPVPAIISMSVCYVRKAPWIVQDCFNIEPGDTPLMKAMRLYYHLNLLGLHDSRFQFRYRIEDIDTAWPRIMAAIGMPGVALPDISRETHSFKPHYQYPALSWADIYRAFPLYGDRIVQLAHDMGYELANK